LAKYEMKEFAKSDGESWKRIKSTVIVDEKVWGGAGVHGWSRHVRLKGLGKL
jgi:hypothetical protein